MYKISNKKRLKHKEFAWINLYQFIFHVSHTWIQILTILLESIIKKLHDWLILPYAWCTKISGVLYKIKFWFQFGCFIHGLRYHDSFWNFVDITCIYIYIYSTLYTKKRRHCGVDLGHITINVQSNFWRFVSSRWLAIFHFQFHFIESNVPMFLWWDPKTTWFGVRRTAKCDTISQSLGIIQIVL